MYMIYKAYFRNNPKFGRTTRLILDGETVLELMGDISKKKMVKQYRGDDGCEFEQYNPHEWYCRTHKVLKVAGTQEPVMCDA